MQRQMQAQASAQRAVSEESIEHQSLDIKAIFSDTQAATATFTRSESALGIACEISPSSSDDKVSPLSWRYTPLQSLRILLEMARIKETCKDISLKDMQYIIRCCDYQGFLEKISLVDKRKLAKIAVKILSYIAKHQCDLSDSVITALKKELSQKDRKTIHYVLLAISYGIHHDKIDPKHHIKPLLINAIEEIKKINKRDYYPTMMIALSALAKLGEYLSSYDLLFIRNQLTDVKNTTHPLYQDECKSLSTTFSKRGGISLFWSCYAELVQMKNDSRNKLLLTQDQLSFAIRQWDKHASNIKVRIKVSHILKQATANGQLWQEENQLFFDVLLKALESDDLKIKQNAIITLNFLAKHGQLPSDIKYRSKLRKAEASYRFYALKGLIYHFEKSDIAHVLPDPTKWIEVLNEVKGDAKNVDYDEKLGPYAEYLQYLLKNDLKSLIKFLLNDKHSIEASLALLNAAKKKMHIDTDTLVELEKLLQGQYSVEAKLNVMLALTCMVENEVVIPISLVKSIIPIIHEGSNETLLNPSLVFLSHCPFPSISAILSSLLLDKLGSLLLHKEVAHNASCLLANIMQGDLGDSFDEDISRLLKRSSDLLIKEDCNIETRQNIGLLILRSVKLNTKYVDASILTNLADALEKNNDVGVKKQILLTIAFIVEGVSSINLPNAMLDFIINELGNDSEEWRSTAKHILCLYVKKTKLHHSTIIAIAGYISKKESLLLVCEVLKSMADSNQSLPEEVLISLTQVNSVLLEIRLIIAEIIYKCSLSQAFSLTVIKNIEKNLIDFSDHVVKYTLLALQARFQSAIVGQSLPKDIIILSSYLLNVAKNNKNESISLIAVNILCQFSFHGKKLSFEILNELISLLASPHNTLRQEVAKLFDSQIDCLKWSIKNKNAGIYEILANLEKYILDFSIVINLLSVLKKAQRYGYNIPKETLKQLSKFVYHHKDEAVQSISFDILCGCEFLPKKLEEIIKLEKASRALMLTEEKTQSVNREMHLQCLLSAAKNKILLTPKCFTAIEIVLKSSSNLHINALDTCLAAGLNGQILQQSLIRAIYDVLSIYSGESNPVIEKAAVVVTEIIAKNGDYLPEKIYFIIENIFMQSAFGINYLPVIEIALKRGIMPTEACINKIIKLLLCEDVAACHEATKVLTCISEELSSDCLNNLTVTFGKITDIHVQAEIARILQHQLRKKSLLINDPSLDHLMKILKDSKDLSIECKILSILEDKQQKQIMPPPIAELILCKKQQHILLDDASNLEVKISAIECLVRYGYFLEKRELVAVEKLIESVYCKRNSSNIVYLKKILYLFPKMIFKSSILSDLCIDLIIDMFINHKDGVVRASSFNIIKHAISKKYVSSVKHGYLEKLVNIELSPVYNRENKEKINWLMREAKKRVAFPLSYNNVNIMCKFIYDTNDLIKNNIIFLLSYEKEKIPSVHYKILLNILFKLLKQEIYYSFVNHQANDLLFYLINKPNVSQADRDTVFSLFSKLLNHGKEITFNHITILDHYIKNLNSMNAQSLIVILAKGFFRAQEIPVQIKILKTLLECAYKCDVLDNFTQSEIVKLANTLNYSSSSIEINRMVCELLNYVNNLHTDFFVESKNDSAIRNINSHFQKNFSKDTVLLDNIRENKNPDTQSRQLGFMLTCLSGHYENLTSMLSGVLSEHYIEKLLCYDLLSRNDDDQKQQLFVKYINNLVPRNKNKLLFFIKLKKSKEYLNLDQINDLLCMLYFYPDNPNNDTLIKQWLCCNMTDNKFLWIKNILSLSGYSIDNSHIEKIMNVSNICTINTLGELLKLLVNDKNKINFDEKIEYLKICLQSLQKYKMTDDSLAGFLKKHNIKIISTLIDKLDNELIKNQIKKMADRFFCSNNINEIEEIREKKSLLLNCVINRLLVNRRWCIDRLYDLLERFLTYYPVTTPLEDIINLLENAYLYNIEESYFYEFYKKSSSRNDTLEIISKNLHIDFLKIKFFKKTGEKKLDQLIDELKSMPINQNNKALLSSDELMLIIQKSNHFYFSECNPKTPIKQWHKSDIIKWALHIKTMNYQTKLLPEIIAVMRRAYLLHCEKEPRDTQLLTLVCLMETGASNLKGRFAQVATGEGKSIIIAMFACIKALFGETVDIITSSHILAKRDADDYRGFYNLFGLNIASNEHSQSYVSGIKDCYEDTIQIVYGEASNFQFDILRHEYSNLKTRGQRNFGVVIVDEVDNLLIDESSTIAMLSNSMPGMDVLISILVSLWHELQFIVSCHNLESKSSLSEDFLRGELIKYCKKIIDSEKVDFIKIPAHLEKFVDIQYPKWIESAILAYKGYEEKHHYTIELNHLGQQVITPVDHANTGVLQNGTTWNNGLQQFLQLKHGLHVSPEGLTTNFLSNVALMDRYKNIYGMTGTLGSERSQALLSHTYSIDFIKIPTFKEKRFIELPGEIITSDFDWKAKIISSAIREAKKGRPVLIICESIKKGYEIFDDLNIIYRGKLREYLKNDKSQGQFLKDPIDSGTIIVATNLASRGTDISMTEDAIQNGGLHVCCTFLPENKRVGEQIFGRASRKGEPGSAQLILNKLDLIKKFGSLENDIEKIKIKRDQIETCQLNDINEVELPTIRLKDGLFVKYLKIINQLNVIDTDNTSYETMLNQCGIGISLCNYLKPEMIKLKRHSVEEQWGLWLKKYELADGSFASNVSHSNVFKEFSIFENTILQEYQESLSIKNAIYWVNLGNIFLKKSQEFKHVFNKESFLKLAIHFYDKAISIDPIYAYIAYYYKAYAIVKMAKNDYKAEARKCLQIVSRIISDNVLAREQAISNVGNNIKKFLINGKITFLNDFSEQILNNVHVLEMLNESIYFLISEIERSQKLSEMALKEGANTKIYRKLECEENLSLIRDSKLSPEAKNITLLLRGLTKHEDITTHYPLLALIEQFEKDCKKSSRVNIIFDSHEFNMKDNVGSIFKKLLPINREIEDKKSTVIEEKKTEDNEKRLIGVAEHVKYVGGKIVSGISTVSQGVSGAATHVVKTVHNRWYDYKKAETLSVSLELKELALINAKAILKDEIKLDNSYFGFVIHNAKQAVFDIVKEDKILSASVEIFIFNHESSDGMRITKSVRNIKEIKGVPTIYDMVFHSKSKSEVLNLLNCLEEELTKSSNKMDLLLAVDLLFDNVSQQYANHIFSHPINIAKLSFKHLEKEDAKRVIYLTDAHYNNTIFEFPNLQKNEAENIIKNINREDYGFSIHEKMIETELLKLNIPSTVITEYINNGYIFVYNMAERSPLPWKSMCLVTTLGVLQIAAGFSLMAATSGFLANFGLGLATEGVADILRVVTAGYTRSLSMGSYVAQKSLSMTISLITAGYAACSAPSTSSNMTQEAVNVVDEAARTVRKGLAQVSLAARHVAIQAGENVVNEGVRAVCLQMSAKGAVLMQPAIIKSTNSIVKKKLLSGDCRSVLQKVFSMDQFVYQNERNYYEEKIINAVDESIGDLSSFVLPGVDLLDLSGIDQFFENFIKKMHDIEEQELDKFNDRFLDRLHGAKYDMDKKDVDAICVILKRESILSENNIIQITNLKKYLIKPLEGDHTSFARENSVSYEMKDYNFDALDLKDYNKHKDILLEICLNHHRIMRDDYVWQINRLSDRVAKKLADFFQRSVDAVSSLMGNAVASLTNMGLNRAARSLEEGCIASKIREKQTVSQKISGQVSSSNSDLNNEMSQVLDSKTGSVDTTVEVNVSDSSLSENKAGDDYPAFRRETLRRNNKVGSIPVYNRGVDDSPGVSRDISEEKYMSGVVETPDIPSNARKKISGGVTPIAPLVSISANPSINDDFIVTSVEIIGSACVEFYKNELQKELDSKIAKTISIFNEISNKTWFMLNSALIEKKKIITILISLIMAEKISIDLENSIRVSINKGSFSRADEEQETKNKIDFTSTKIVELIVKLSLEKAYQVIKQYVGADLNHCNNDNEFLLQKTLNEYFKLEKGKVMSLNRVIELASEHLKLEQYGKTAALLNEQKLSEKGYIACAFIDRIGSTVDGLVKAKTLSIEARARVQLAVAEITKQTLKEQSDLVKSVVKTVQDRSHFMKGVTKMLDDRLKENAQSLALFAKLKTEKERLAFMDVVKTQSLTIREVVSKLKGIADANGIPSTLIENSYQHMEDIAKMAFQTFMVLGAQDVEETRLLKEQMKETLREIAEITKGVGPRAAISNELSLDATSKPALPAPSSTSSSSTSAIMDSVSSAPASAAAEPRSRGSSMDAAPPERKTKQSNPLIDTLMILRNLVDDLYIEGSVDFNNAHTKLDGYAENIEDLTDKQKMEMDSMRRQLQRQKQLQSAASVSSSLLSTSSNAASPPQRKP